MNIEEKESWMTPIIHFLKRGNLLRNKKEARKIKHRLAYFFIKNEQIYNKGFALPSLHCLNPNEANYVLREMHEGIYGSHLVRITISLKAIQLGYYWPKMKLDALKLV